MEDTHALQLPSRTLFLFERLRCIERRICYVTLPWEQNCWISTNCCPAKMAEKSEKIDMYVFPVHMIALRTKTVAHATMQWPSVEIHNFCYHGRATSHFSSLLPRRSSGASVNIPQLLVFSVTPFIIDQTKNQNRSVDKVQNLRNERRYIYKDPGQDSGQRNISYTRYPKKCFTQTYRDLYGDAMLVLTWMSSNMADRNQQKHLLPSFAT